MSFVIGQSDYFDFSLMRPTQSKPAVTSDYIIKHIVFTFFQILTLNRSTLEDNISENTINLVSNDAQAVEKMGYAIFSISFVPLDIVASVVLVWYLVAWPALIGASFFLLVVAYGSFAAHKAGKVRHQSAAVTDKRLEIMKEIITGIRVVKMYAWEWNFTDLVAQIRRLVHRGSKRFISIKINVLLFTCVSVFLSRLEGICMKRKAVYIADYLSRLPLV